MRGRLEGDRRTIIFRASATTLISHVGHLCGVGARRARHLFGTNMDGPDLHLRRSGSRRPRRVGGHAPAHQRIVRWEPDGGLYEAEWWCSRDSALVGRCLSAGRPDRVERVEERGFRIVRMRGVQARHGLAVRGVAPRLRSSPYSASTASRYRCSRGIFVAARRASRVGARRRREHQRRIGRLRTSGDWGIGRSSAAGKGRISAPPECTADPNARHAFDAHPDASAVARRRIGRGPMMARARSASPARDLRIPRPCGCRRP